jgi:collagenase-like PrtC family protease
MLREYSKSIRKSHKEIQGEKRMTDIKIEVIEEAGTCCGGSGQCGCNSEEKSEIKAEGSCCGGSGSC